MHKFPYRYWEFYLLLQVYWIRTNQMICYEEHHKTSTQMQFSGPHYFDINLRLMKVYLPGLPTHLDNSANAGNEPSALKTCGDQRQQGACNSDKKNTLINKNGI